MSLTASARAVPGSLLQKVTVDGRFLLETDEPLSVGGGGTAPSPHELLPAALAACASTTLVMYGRTKGWDLGQVVVEADYDHRARPRTCTLRILLERPLTPEQVTRLERVVATCPVRQALGEGLVFDEHVLAGAGARFAATTPARPARPRPRAAA